MDRIRGLPSSTNPHSPHIHGPHRPEGHELAIVPEPEREPPLIELFSSILQKPKRKQSQLKSPNVVESPMQRRTTRSMKKLFIKPSNIALNIQPSIFVDLEESLDS